MSARVYQGEPVLRNRFIFLSASKPSRNYHKFPLASMRANRTSEEIDEAVVSLARAVFCCGGRLVFGGHPTISPLVASVAAEYFPARYFQPGHEPVWIYQSEAFRKVIPRSTEHLEELGYARIHWIDRYDAEDYEPARAGQEQCLQSLRLMRQALIDLRPSPGQHPTDFPAHQPVAMVAIGGMEGIIREAHLFLKKTASQIYLLRSTAGAASMLLPYLRDNLLEEPAGMWMPDWDRRISILEDIFPIPDGTSVAEHSDALPLAPYAVLMQRMVLSIARGQPNERTR